MTSRKQCDERALRLNEKNELAAVKHKVAKRREKIDAICRPEGGEIEVSEGQQALWSAKEGSIEFYKVFGFWGQWY